MGEFCNNIELELNRSLPVSDFINVNVSSFLGVCRSFKTLELDSATEAKYGEPMVLIGNYIAATAALCYAFMIADLGLVLNHKKFWLPMTYFSFNAASITVIGVAMKLPMDLTSPMPSEIDQVAKVGGLGCLCIMMSTLLPSLASMDNKSLLGNVSGLFILVITLVVNVGIQIRTQVIARESFYPFVMSPYMATCIYMGMLLFLLIIFVSFALTIPTIKKVVELKYQVTLNDQNLQENPKFSAEELRQLVKRLWIMVETSSPQLVLATTPLSLASNVICTISMLVYISSSWHASWYALRNKHMHTSVYKHTTTGITVVQLMGVVGGAGSVYRCFAVLRFKSIANQSRNQFSVFKVEKHWTHKLCEWKENPIRMFSFFRIVWLYNHILSICIIFQKVIVVLCKIIELIPISVIIFVINCSYYLKSLKAILFTLPTATSSEDTDEELINYAFLLQDDARLTKYSVKKLLDTINKYMQTGGMPQDNKLLKLLEKSVAFEGVETFDNDQIQSLLPIELVSSWSLPIISLTCIAIAIPNIDEDLVDNLLESVGKGLYFTRTVEESLNKALEYVNIQRATRTLWSEIIDKNKWLDTTLKGRAYEEKTPIDIIKLFAYSSEEILNEFNRGTNGESVEKENIPSNVIAANSMYRIAQTILYRYENNNLEIIEDELFTRLSNMIADILVACLTNLPRVIISKCQESALITKRADSVMDAFWLIEQSYEIIKILETRELPNLNSEKMGFIDEWRLHFKQP